MKKEKTLSKDQAAEYLKSKGYNSAVESGVVMTYVPIGTTNTQEIYEQIQILLKEAGYNASYGIKAGSKDITKQSTN